LNNSELRASIKGHEMKSASTALFCFILASPVFGQTMERFPAASSDAAWKLLPRESLPVWARILVQPLPNTTGAMLQLDYVHRAKNPIGEVLAGKLRWIAADEIKCEYAKAYAEADLRRAGFKDMKQLIDPPTEADRAVLTFGRKLTRAAHEVTDEEVAGLIKKFGPEHVVGMVHTLACANFQNRIYLALKVTVEPEGPLAPIDYRFDSTKTIEAQPRPTWGAPTKGGQFPAKLEWSKKSIADLENALTNQKDRKARIPLPDAKAQGKVIWTNVSMGYQPLLAKSWSACRRAFQQESNLDRVFANSMFWVITRSNECFY
jgi:hypothetical protein